MRWTIERMILIRFEGGGKTIRHNRRDHRLEPQSIKHFVLLPTPGRPAFIVLCGPDLLAVSAISNFIAPVSKQDPQFIWAN